MNEKINEMNEEKVFNREYNMFRFFGLVFPSVFTVVVLSVYLIIDGRFISQYVSPYAISAVNLYFPVLSLLSAIGTMIGTGANAYILNLIGAGKKEDVNRIFSQIIEISLIISVAFSAVCFIFMNPILRLLGATVGNMDYLKDYYVILTIFAPAIMLQTVLGTLIIGEGKTVLAGVLAIAGGVINVVLDYVFVAKCNMGTSGAALASAIGNLIPVLYALVLFSKKGSSRYTFEWSSFHFRAIGRILYNGSSEMVATLATGVSTFMMNHIAYDFAGEMGVSAVSVYLDVHFIVISVFIGFTTAVEPLFSFYHGKKDIRKINKTFKLSMIWILIFSLIMLAVILLFSQQIANLIFNDSTRTTVGFYRLAQRSVLLTAPVIIFEGFNVMTSGLFTAFGNGTVSAILSGLRTFVILIICMMIMPKLFGLNGLWLSRSVAEGVSVITSIIFLVAFQRRYFQE